LPIDRASTSGRAILERRTVQVEDMQAEAEEYPRGYAIAHRLGHRTIVVAPLFREGKPFGTIVLRRQEVRPFSEPEKSLLRTFGDQAAIALENVRLFNETREALEQQTATAEVLRVISSSVADAQPVFEKIIDSCHRLFDAEVNTILLVRDEDQIDVAAHRGAWVTRDQLAAIYPQPLLGTIHGRAINARNALHFPTLATVPDPPADVQAVYAAVGDHSFLVAPMLWEDRGIGTLIVARQPPRPFSDKEISLLTTFADQAVIAIQNARLFNETNEALEQQTATAEVLRVISSSVADTAPVFEMILDSCERLFAVNQLGIFLAGDDEMLHYAATRGPMADEVRSILPVPLDQT
ncbi:MAG: GAF domain-containing protein, partial [Gammaproteobacteria bacterium]